MKRPSPRLAGITLLTFAALAAGCGPAEFDPAKPKTWPAGFNTEAIEIIDAIAGGIVEGGHAPGVALLIGRGDEVLMRRVYGHRMSEPAADPMTFDTLFDLASVTKATCTSAAVMLLVQDGLIGLDDPVERYVPQFEGQSKGDITIRHLLTHTSGLAAYTNAEALARDYGPGPNPEGLIDRIARGAKVYETGRGYTYSCLNYLTLARAVQNVTGKNMERLLRERVWGPLAMDDTTFYPDAGQIARSAPTIDNENELRRGSVHDPLAHYAVCEAYAPGNAGAFSTIDDMGRYVRMLLGGGDASGGRVFDPDTLQVIMTEQTDPQVASRTAGWGVWDEETYSTPLNRTPETLTLGHTGYTGNIIWMDKLSGAYVIMFTNCVYPDDDPANKDAVVAARRRVIRTVIDHLDVYQEGREGS